MENYPSNSNAAKQQRIEKSTKPNNGVTIKKRSEARKFADAFLADDLNSIKTHIISDVLIPELKNALYDIATNALDAILYGSSGNPSKKKSVSSKFSYITPYHKMSNNNANSEHIADRPKKTYEYDELLFDTRGKAESILKDMDSHIGQYGMVSIADYYEFAEMTSEYTTNKYGWTDIRGAKVVPYRGKYRIANLPKAAPLD